MSEMCTLEPVVGSASLDDPPAGVQLLTIGRILLHGVHTVRPWCPCNVRGLRGQEGLPTIQAKC